mmetsp:Transcript_17303/g.48748  ORF Transcript_17303/g.48748 Transcript_17303/m.48748 type:complete len:127 (+) Transcript_17303:141-521(+)|eukprot:CAMPEP_0119551192 /NCGR_PEP_ID=MMETSP1352-20130426/4510_1 /TAXON_ID=265584 /ORGANISM="Stauroneis constricta, Strain CCMP1120" /LENGTH=126 /DNA_ID=CAMNT_0007597203 /DNA_START=152 /DNA_END=532 /DNA_ORIENTATION=+
MTFALKLSQRSSIAMILRSQQHRGFASAPAQKLQSVLESYRETHFSREIHSRFKKELLQPYATPSGGIPIDQLNEMLVNIGQGQHALSQQEQQILLQEAGGQITVDGHTGMIPLDKMMELLSANNE